MFAYGFQVAKFAERPDLRDNIHSAIGRLNFYGANVSRLKRTKPTSFNHRWPRHANPRSFGSDSDIGSAK